MIRKAGCYVLKEDLDDVLSGRKEPEPIVIRANAGEAIRFEFTNMLPETIGGNAFQLVNERMKQGCMFTSLNLMYLLQTVRMLVGIMTLVFFQVKQFAINGLLM